jgi:WD40 repeat protein
MLALLVACFASADWAPPDRPGLVARIGSTAFRHPNPHGPQRFWLHVSADGKRLYTGVYKGVQGSLSWVYVWDARSGKVLRSYDPRGGADRISSFCFAPDGLRVLIDVRDESIPFDGKHRFQRFTDLGGGKKRVIHVWDSYQFRLLDPDTGEVLRRGRPWPAREFDSESWTAADWIVSGDEKQRLLLDPVTGKTLSFDPPVERDKAWIRAVAPDGLTALVGTDEGKRRLYDLPRGELRAEWEDDEPARGSTYTPDGKFLALWEQKKKDQWTLKLRGVFELSTRSVLENQEDRPWMVFAPDGKIFALERPRLRYAVSNWEFHDTATGKLLGTSPELDAVPHFSPDGRTVWTTFGMRVMIPWDVRTGSIRAGGPDVPGPVTAFRFEHEDQLIGLSGGSVITWDATSGKELARVPERQGRDWNSRGLFSPLADRLLYVEEDFVWWDVRTRTEQRVVMQPKPPARDEYRDITADGRLFMTWGSGTFTVRDTSTGKVILDRPQPNQNPPPRDPQRDGPLPEFANSPDCKRLAVYQHNEWSSTFVILDLTNRKAPARHLDSARDPRVKTFSPDSRFLAAVGVHWSSRTDIPNELTIWSATTGRMLKRVPLPGLHPEGLSYSPDGRLLAVAFDGRVVVADTERARVVANVRTCAQMDSWRWNRYGQQAPAWSPSGRLLAVETPDERLMIWDVSKLTSR